MHDLMRCGEACCPARAPAPFAPAHPSPLALAPLFSVLYGEELHELAERHPLTMQLDIVKSMQEKNKEGGLLYGEVLSYRVSGYHRREKAAG